MLRRNRFYWLLVTGYWLLSISSVYAEDINLKEPIVVNGDKVEYFHDKKMVTGTGNISITYKDVVLTCEKVTVYLDTREAIAEGDVKITQKDAYFTGEKMNYNFDTKAGKVINAYVNSTPFYGKSKEVDKAGEKQIDLERGYITTCDLDDPHYRVAAKQVKIYLDDKVVAKHIVFYIGKVPVMYFPYYVQPLEEYTAHATIMPGRDSEWGYYALTSFKYSYSDIANGRARIDYRSKKGLAVGVDDYYSTKGIGNGSFKFYCINEYDLTAFDPPKGAETTFKYMVQLRHKWDITDDTNMVMEINKVKDQNFIKDYFYKEFEEQGDPDNYISIITSKPDHTTQLIIRKRLDKYYNVVERLPEFRIDIPNYRFFEKLPVYFKTDTSAVYLNEKFASAVPSVKDVSAVRLDTYNRLTYMTKVLGFLSLAPYAGMEQTYYSRNAWGDTNLVRGIFDAGLDVSTKFYKIYDYSTDFLGLDINKLRHIITPTANYYYRHQPTISPNNLNQFDDVDSRDTDNGVRLALENKLQTKRGSPGSMTSVDLMNFIISSDYAFRLKDNNLAYKSQKFETLDFQLELYPYPWLYSISKMGMNTKKYNIKTASVDFMAIKNDNYWGFGYRYENPDSDNFVNLITTEAMYRINNDWKARVYWRYNIDKSSFEEQEYTVYKDLHCWILEFTYDIKAEQGDQTFWLIFRLKSFPRMPLGIRNTYSRARPGPAQQELPNPMAY